MQASEKKRPKEEKDIAQRLKPLAKLQNAEDYDVFVDGIICRLCETVSRLNAYGTCRGVDSAEENPGATTLQKDGTEDGYRYRAI